MMTSTINLKTPTPLENLLDTSVLPPFFRKVKILCRTSATHGNRQGFMGLIDSVPVFSGSEVAKEFKTLKAASKFLPFLYVSYGIHSIELIGYTQSRKDKTIFKEYEFKFDYSRQFWIQQTCNFCRFAEDGKVIYE